MKIRRYQSSDCKYLAELFDQTVHTINRKDYTKEQCDVWASGYVDLKQWDQSFHQHYTVVAIENDIIVGFGDIDDSGYLDRLYVHKDYQRRGIASAICNCLEQAIDVEEIVTHASLTAKVFFEKRGYQVVKQQQVNKKGIDLINYVMKKSRTTHLK